MAISTSGVNVPTIGNLSADTSWLQSQPKNQMSMADMVNLARGKVALQKERETLEPSIQQATAQAQQAQTQAQNANLDLQNKKRATMLNVLTPYASDDRVTAAQNLPPNATPEQIKQAQNGLYEVGNEAVNQLVDSGWDRAEAMQFVHPYNNAVGQSPMMAAGYLKRGVQSLAGAQNIAEQNQLQVGQNQAGLATTFTKANPGGTMQVIGQNPQTEANISKGDIEQFNSDLTQTRKENQEAQGRIATLRNIQNVAQNAYLGVGADRKAFATSLLQGLGVNVNAEELANTQELAKNTAILQLAGGNTDTAREIAEIANPNGHMSKQAINDVVSQLTGMERMKQARATYLLKYANDPMAYNRNSQKFNTVNDPLLFQDLTPEEANAKIAKMTDQQKTELAKKYKKAVLMGVIQ
jgi:hypothetical protein